MYKKTITYTDYNDKTVTEDFYFNLNKAELLEIEMEREGGMSEYLNTLVKTNDPTEILKVFKDLIGRSVGKKSDDGRRFIKNDEILADFMQTEAYSQLFMEFATNAEEAARFVNGIMPKDLLAEAAKKSDNPLLMPAT